MNQTDPNRRERYCVAIHDAMETDLSLVDQEPAFQALIARAAEAAMALADAELAVPSADQNRQFLTTLANLGITSHRLNQIRDAARLHRQQLIGTNELYAVIDADDSVQPAAAPAVVSPPTSRAAVLLDAADRIDLEDLPDDYVDLFDNGARWATDLLRRLAVEAHDTGTQQQDAADADYGPSAEELAGHLAAQRMSVLQGAFRILGWPPLRFELVEDDEPAPAEQQPAAATAYGDGKGRVYCLACASKVGADVPLTADDVDPWELCPSCGRHVIDVARTVEQQPAAAPQPTPCTCRQAVHARDHVTPVPGCPWCAERTDGEQQGAAADEARPTTREALLRAGAIARCDRALAGKVHPPHDWEPDPGKGLWHCPGDEPFVI